MAYDQNAPYQPPRRAYYGQAQPQAPVQSSYADYQDQRYAEYEPQQSYHQQAHGSYDGYDQYQHYDEYGQGQHDGQRWNENESYQGAYDQGNHQEQWHENREHHGSRERSYEPRYQQRGPRGPPTGESLSGNVRPRPPPERQGYQIQPNNRQNPPPPQSARMNDRQQYGRPDGDSRTNGDRSQRKEPSRGQSRDNNHAHDPTNDWRARERAKMNASATSPDYLPQDTAFPKFGNKKERPGTSEGRSSTRSSEDRRRPGSGRTDGQAQRPLGPGERESGRERSSDGYSAQQGRPSTAHAASTTHRGPTNSFPDGPGYQRQPPRRQQATKYTEHPVDDMRSQQWPLSNDRVPTPSQSEQRRPVQTGGYPPHAEPIPRAASARPQNESYQPSYSQQGPDHRQRTARTLPAVQPIDTGNHPSQATFMGHPQLGSMDVIRRPATASGARSVPAAQMASPISHVPQSATIENYATPKPWMQHTASESLDDLYDGYGASASAEAPKSREQEIEAEMPDFGSAAKPQASSSHKRNQTVDRHLDDHPAGNYAPPMPAVPSQYNDRQNQGYRPKNEEPSWSESGFSGARLQQSHSNPTDLRTGMGSSGTYTPQGDRRGPVPDGHSNRFPPPGRSQTMDDSRQMAYRPGPSSSQRYYQQDTTRDGPPPPGPQQARPILDRAATDQSTWSDPGQRRAPSAPPGGQSRPQPPNAGSTRGPYDQAIDPRQPRNSNPDALPHHPAPVRAGLLDQGPSQPSKPPPVRSYTNVSKDAASTAPQGQSRQNPEGPFAQPVTRQELDRLRAEVEANPHNPKRALIFAKKLVEAATVLANEGGRLDQKTAAKNRERYTMEGYKRVKKLVNQGYPEAQFYLADCYGQGMLGLEVDTKEAFTLYQAAAKQGHGQAAYRTAVCCEMGPEEGGGTRRDFPKAVQWYRRAAALGDTAAMFKLGAVLLKGLLGQPRNVGEAVTWLKRAAERADNDNPHPLHELASLYESANADPEVRNKVIADDNYARDLYHRAAKLGYKYSQFRLGQAYEYGLLGLTIDNRQSITWYTKAAAQGEHQAELALSGWYLTGAEGILEHSDTEAYLWARKAAMSEPPLAKALYAMGYFTEEGIGCPASLDEAKKWYGRAASQKFPKALERLEALRKNGGKKPAPTNGRIMRKDQKRDESECVLM